ncbi:MAG: biosynthetic arginine decarboxylase [Thermoanaerobaculia bacterium]
MKSKTEIAEHDEETWTSEDADSLYLINRWGSGYFHVNPEGYITVSPLRERGAAIPVFQVLQEALEQGLQAPLVIRFQDLLRDRVDMLNQAFQKAIAENRFGGYYRGVFPIKVNQLREVVEEILDAGRPHHYGIEVGSKPELFGALAVHNDPESLIICNGYKDTHYIRMALIGRKLGKRIIIVAEKLSEVRGVVRVAQELGVEPMIGMRVRLNSEGEGLWATSGGEHAKFGLSTDELLEGLEILRGAGMSESFKLLHFHIGSQVPDIMTIKRAVREAARYYAKLQKMGHSLEFLDVGGGLAIDYDGSRSTFHSSMNYTVQEYANDIVYNIMDICDEEEVPHPNIVSESGRAIVAHHSVLVVEAFGAIEKTPIQPVTIRNQDHKLIQELKWLEEHLDERRLTESWHDLQQLKGQSESMFEYGLLELDVKAGVEILYWRIAEGIEARSHEIEESDIPEDLLQLRRELADQQICNFSVFQSLLDHWAVGQLFPIVPIHRLNEKPNTESTLVDITCDSDGKVSKFIDIEDTRSTLPLHEFEGLPYYLGVFLTGAYQDIMGDMHNLFGRVNEAHVFLDEDEESGFYIEETIPGNTIGEVLALTQYDVNDLAKKMKAQFDAAIKEDRLRPNEGMRLLAEYERGLRDQTYLTLN